MFFTEKKNATGMNVLFSHLLTYRNDPKFSDGQVRANSVDPDQTAV